MQRITFSSYSKRGNDGQANYGEGWAESVRARRLARTPSPQVLLRVVMDVAMNRLWHELLQEAIHANEPAAAELMIQRAERAILRRIQDIWPGPSAVEEQALFDALGTIRALRSARRLPQKLIA